MEVAEVELVLRHELEAAHFAPLMTQKTDAFFSFDYFHFRARSFSIELMSMPAGPSSRNGLFFFLNDAAL